MAKTCGASVMRVGIGIGLGRLSICNCVTALRIFIFIEKPRSLSREESSRGSLS